MTRRARLTLPILVLIAIAGCDGSRRARPALRVAAAASVSDVATATADRFERDQPGNADVSVASTGRLVVQVEAGAPYDVIITAGRTWMDRLVDDDLVDPTTRTSLASNAIALVVPAVDGRLDAFDGLRDPAYARIAIGRPDSVPAGAAARAILTERGLWASVEPRLVPCANVRQALAYVAQGEVDAGLVFLTDARAGGPVVRIVTHEPLTEVNVEAAVVRAASHGALARRFIAMLGDAEGRATLEEHGFRVE